MQTHLYLHHGWSKGNTDRTKRFCHFSIFDLKPAKILSKFAFNTTTVWSFSNHIFFSNYAQSWALKIKFSLYRYYLKESIFWFFLPQKLGTFTWSNRFPNWRWILHFQKNHVATMCITTRVISLDFLFLSFLCKSVTSCDIGTTS